MKRAVGMRPKEIPKAFRKLQTFSCRDDIPQLTHVSRFGNANQCVDHYKRQEYTFHLMVLYKLDQRMRIHPLILIDQQKRPACG
jgi:hypothetical protein